MASTPSRSAKMPAVSGEQFLFSCIENSNNGTINWEAVATQCGIVSKGAAAIKFKRMKDKFGTVAGDAAPSASEDGTPAAEGAAPNQKGKKTPARKSPVKRGSKKRKLSDAASADGDADEGEAATRVKDEEDDA